MSERADSPPIECRCPGCEQARKLRDLALQLEFVRGLHGQAAAHRDRLLETVRGLRAELDQYRYLMLLVDSACV